MSSKAMDDIASNVSEVSDIPPLDFGVEDEDADTKPLKPLLPIKEPERDDDHDSESGSIATSNESTVSVHMEETWEDWAPAFRKLFKLDDATAYFPNGSRKKIRVATGCSGSDGPLYALEKIFESMGVTDGTDIIDHVYSHVLRRTFWDSVGHGPGDSSLCLETKPSPNTTEVVFLCPLPLGGLQKCQESNSQIQDQGREVGQGIRSSETTPGDSPRDP